MRVYRNYDHRLKRAIWKCGDPDLFPHVHLESIFTLDEHRFRIQFGVVEQETLRNAILAMKVGNPPDNLESETFTGILEFTDGQRISFIPDEALEHHYRVLHACWSAAGLIDKDARSYHIAARIDATVAWLASSDYLSSWPQPARLYAKSQAEVAEAKSRPLQVDKAP